MIAWNHIVRGLWKGAVNWFLDIYLFIFNLNYYMIDGSKLELCKTSHIYNFEMKNKCSVWYGLNLRYLSFLILINYN